MSLEYAARTHLGRRSNNEDAHVAAPQLGLFAVADGMGGYEGGEVASRTVVDSLAEFFRRNASDDDVTWPYGIDPRMTVAENMLDVAVRAAHRDVLEKKCGRLAQMGSTVAALALAGGAAIVGHVGDSRVYRLRDGRLEQLTRDHSLYAELAASGTPDLPPREAFPHANVITRAIGIGDEVRPDVRTCALAPGDVFLLCSDGLIEKLSDAVLAEALAAYAPDEACRRLVDEAYARGGRDNITAIVVRVR